MREILGKRRRLLRGDGKSEQISAALTFATQWRWPVLPGVATHPQGHSRCGCPDPDCTVPGAHPFDPGLLAATTDERMLRWWWTNRQAAPIILATGGQAPCAVSLPALPGRSRTHRTRPHGYAPRPGRRLARPLGDPGEAVLHGAAGRTAVRQGLRPGSLRFHGEGGYIALPPSETGQGPISWQRAPLPGSASPWVPDVEAVVDAVVEALARTGVSAPEL
ncbi:bifunctional DNA primase/polymerase [Streptomyces sp. MS1.AVA.1]|uniref:Bifunctional DNA primase/polymerase n=1 Tax=Streptomyces machairae TaxID=3134109 RepID=A0ABU8UMH5_9ACTN